MKLRWLLALLWVASMGQGGAAAPAAPEQVLHVFAVAHPDDWALFMNPTVFESLKQPGARTLLIHSTAGDAGLGSQGGARAFYLAREAAALQALRFLLYASAQRAEPLLTLQPVTIQGHTLQRWRHGERVSAYFLRLPDGGTRGKGYATTGHASLGRFLDGTLAQLEAVDGSTRYQSRADLLATLQALMLQEQRSNERLVLHLADPEARLNRHDHPDHLATTQAVQAANVPCLEQRLYLTYASSRQPAHLSREEALIEAGTWGALTTVLGDWGFASTWDEEHNAWLGRNLWRVQPCALP
ncbi:MAG: PIG-L family deacetylase [Candidatus Sericytochromatia bacterium]